MSRNASPAHSPYRRPARPPGEDPARVQLALEGALEDWWQQGRLPPPELLRDGLFLLQAGHPLDPAAVSLLLRAALAYHKGMVTALRYQPDAERAAVILADALLAEPPRTLSLAELEQLRRADEGSAAWMALLPPALYEETNSADARRRRRALALTEALGAGLPLPPQALEPSGYVLEPSGYALEPSGYALIEAEDWVLGEDGAAGQPRRRGMLALKGALLLALLAILILAGLWWQGRERVAGMVAVPAGVYAVSAVAAGGAETMEVPAFLIDRTEVTIGAYRRCIGAGRCPQPSVTAGETRPNYLLDGAFDGFPMVNVNWEAASAFCAWRGARLPSAVEWEAAASVPGSTRQRAYPWGEQFQLQRANSAATAIGDTQQAGSYQPVGDSALGVADLAGNVAEWTGANVGSGEGGGEGGGEDRFLVKGGSYRDDPAGLTVGHNTALAASFSAPWLGFRCAADGGGSWFGFPR